MTWERRRSDGGGGEGRRLEVGDEAGAAENGETRLLKATLSKIQHFSKPWDDEQVKKI